LGTREAAALNVTLFDSNLGRLFLDKKSMTSAISIAWVTDQDLAGAKMKGAQGTWPHA
jgi:hypothetical protein